jgi:hypothetical protein
VAFPLPGLLTTIDSLLRAVSQQDGMLLVNDGKRATFLSFPEVDAVLSRLRVSPGGEMVAGELCRCLLRVHGQGPVKPVLVFREDGGFWLGLMAPEGQAPMSPAVAHLSRCLALEH